MSDDYVHELLKKSVARTCLALGIKQTSPQVLDCLADIMKQYITTIAKATTEHSQYGKRVHPSIQDVIYGLRAVKTSRRDLREFIAPSNNSEGWKQPFPHDTPSIQDNVPFNSSISSSDQITKKSDEILILRNIPTHLPSFPPAFTYKRKHIAMEGQKRKVGNESFKRNNKTSKSIGMSLQKIEDEMDNNV